MTKHQCRKTIRKTLKHLLSQRKEEAAFNLLNKFSYLKNKNILSFASMKDEVNLWPLNQNLISTNNLFLPKVDENELKVYQVRNFNLLKKSTLGILEPDISICNIATLDIIDIVFVPGLAFDKENNRLGYGKGFYDKLLSNFHGKRIGLCFKEQVLKSLPIEPHDQRVDYFFSF